MNRRIAILISGRGSNMVALMDAIAVGRLTAEIAVVISNREDAAGIELARERGCEVVIIPHRGLTRHAHEELVIAEIVKRDVALICLAGYMRLLSAEFVQAFPHRILNIHPSLLPAFPGVDVQRQALEHGVQFSGCTVHFVDEQCDGGPIVMQAVVPVKDDDTPETLATRILVEEHRVYARAVQFVLDGQWRIEGRRVLGPRPH